MAENTLNRNGKMLLANWFEIDEKDYIWYKLQGYTIAVNSDLALWLLNGNYHREDGPAVIWANGTQEWHLNGKRHREDCPAYIGADGTQEWWLNGQLHREDGPAYIGATGTQSWRLNGDVYTEQEWQNAVSELV